MTLTKIFFYLVISFFAYNTSNATDHYVDKNATSGGNNGTSWANAWQSFSAINWGSISPGDIVYISGGTDSTVYNEQLWVQASGTADNHITIRNSYEAGHNGRVIIDIVDYSTDGIQIGTSGSNHPDYIYIKGFEVRRGSRGVHVRYACEVITLDSLILINNFGRGIRMAGMDMSGGSPVYALDGYCADSLTVKNSIIITPDNQNEETDCVYFQDAAHIYLYNNFFHCRNRSPVNNHSDVIQSNRTRGWRIVDNVLISDSNAQGMPMIVGVWDGYNDGIVDSFIVYNNYFYGGGIWRTGAPWVAVGNTGWNSYYANYGDYPPTIIVHNTFVSHGPYVAGFHIEFPATMVNNIIAQFGDGVGYGGSSGYWLSAFRTSPTTSVDSIRENLIWTEWLDDMKVQGYISGNGNSGTCYNWSTWVNTYGGTGVSDDPLFVDQIGYIGDQSTLDGELQANSPAINQGEDVQALIESMGLPWTDINGNARDNTPDIGAYQYVPRGPDIIPPEVTGTALLDSVTLRITFSEPLDPLTAQNPNNYSINNGITVVSALLTGSVVTLTTSPHANGTYTVTVSNVEDIAGNIVSPTANSADYDWTVIQDVTPPEVTGASLLDSVTLKIIFSEPLEQSSAQNTGNYSITNNIDVLGASLSGTEVTLTTSEHSPGIYTVTVINVKDLAGNTIDSTANSADYEVIEYTDSVSVSLRSFLEGPYNDDAMLNDLSDQNLIPLTQPYYNTPWNYPGEESVSEIPEEVVDWVLLEIRSGIEVSSIVARRAAFLIIDGTIKDLNGESTVEFPEVSSGHYYVVVHHRNHLSIMTKDPIYLSESSELYDFTTSLEKAYGNQPMKQLAGGKFGLYAADGNANGNINRADNKSVWRKQNGSVGYKSGDYDMNGGVNIKDKNAIYKPNKGRNTGVPMN